MRFERGVVGLLVGAEGGADPPGEPLAPLGRKYRPVRHVQRLAGVEIVQQGGQVLVVDLPARGDPRDVRGNMIGRLVDFVSLAGTLSSLEMPAMAAGQRLPGSLNL